VRPIVEFRFALRADFFALRGPLSLIAWRYSRMLAILVDALATHWSRADTRTNRSPKPCSGASHNRLVLSIQVVVSVPCQIIYATARYGNIRTLPCLSTLCQGDSAISMLSSSYDGGYEPSRAAVYVSCVGMDVVLLSIDFSSTCDD
jgi:hypothetical protein